jgi:hypothetical protein
MSLRLLFRGIAATVKRHEATFREARAVEPRFAPYPTGPDVLTAAAPGSPVPMRERQQLVSVFLGLHQTTRHPLWQALLLQAFRPTLFALRRRQYGPEEDRDARLLVAFLQVVARTPRTGHALFLTIGRATARAVFQAVHAELGETEGEPLDETMPDIAGNEDPEPFQKCLAHEVAERIAARPGGEDLVRVLAGVETAVEQAHRLGAARTGVRKRKGRALEELRAELRPPSEPADDE